jgi:hypothetical protein
MQAKIQFNCVISPYPAQKIVKIIRQMIIGDLQTT